MRTAHRIHTTSHEVMSKSEAHQLPRTLSSSLVFRIVAISIVLLITVGGKSGCSRQSGGGQSGGGQSNRGKSSRDGPQVQFGGPSALVPAWYGVTYDYGTQKVGTESQPVAFRFRPFTAIRDPVRVDDLRFDPAPNSSNDFAISRDGCSSITLQPDQPDSICEVDIVFRPTEPSHYDVFFVMHATVLCGDSSVADPNSYCSPQEINTEQHPNYTRTESNGKVTLSYSTTPLRVIGTGQGNP
jgi:hypothetical protein